MNRIFFIHDAFDPTDMSLIVHEVFHSIQGESSYAGTPCVFVRLTGCNLRCAFCDTPYAYSEGKKMGVGEILALVDRYGCNLIEVTGGEPLIQEGTPVLVKKLLDQGYRVLLETNGSQDISLVDPRCVRIVDLKCPSSGESRNNDLDNLARLSDHDELKFVVGDREDFEWAKEILAGLPGYPDKKRNIFFSVVFGKLPPRTVAEWILRERLAVRLQLQLHKYIWDPDTKGV